MSERPISSVRGTEPLSYPQRVRLGRIIKEKLPVKRAEVLSLSESGYEIEVEPPFDRRELESIAAQFVAERLVAHQPASLIETDR